MMKPDDLPGWLLATQPVIDAVGEDLRLSWAGDKDRLLWIDALGNVSAIGPAESGFGVEPGGRRDMSLNEKEWILRFARNEVGPEFMVCHVWRRYYQQPPQDKSVRQCWSHGVDHVTYGWGVQIDPRWSDEQIAAYNAGFDRQACPVEEPVLS